MRAAEEDESSARPPWGGERASEQKRRAARGKKERKKKRRASKKKKCPLFCHRCSHLSFAAERERDLEAERRPQVKGGPVFMLVSSACKRDGFEAKEKKVEQRAREQAPRRSEVSRNSSVFSSPSLVVRISAPPALSSAPLLPLVPDIGELERPVRRPQGDHGRGRGQEAGQVGENCGIRRRRRFLCERRRRRRRRRRGRRRSHRLRSSSWSCSSSSSSSGVGAPGALHAVGPRSRAALVGLALWVQETAMREENGVEQALSLSLGRNKSRFLKPQQRRDAPFAQKLAHSDFFSLSLSLFHTKSSRSLALSLFVNVKHRELVPFPRARRPFFQLEHAR